MYNLSVLDLLYLKLEPQGSLMTFTAAVFYLGSNAISNIFAKTSDGFSQWATFLTTTIVWDLLQTYTSILTNTINPIGGTITIGNTDVNTNVEISTQTGRTAVLHLGDGPNSTGDIHIGNGLGSTNHVQLLHAGDNGSSGVLNLGNSTSTLNLLSPMTPIRNYPVIPNSLPSNSTITFGTGIGQVLVRANNGSTRFFGNGNVFCFADQTLSIPVGIWYLVGETITNKTFGAINGLSFGITTPSQPVTTRPATFFGGNFTIHFSSSAQNNTSLPFGGAGSTIGAIYVNNTGANQTVGSYHFQPGFGWENGGVGYLTALRIG